MTTDLNLIRNFAIIAHIDHGKSTLADRMIEYCGGLERREMTEQVLDSMDIEKERGITIKAQTVRLNYKADDGKTYQLNLMDTPGHVDFSYEVSRSLASCEGSVLVVDATQGVEAQTLANVYLALDNNHEIVPVLNKVDLPSADAARVKQQIEDVIGLDASGAVETSGKTGFINGILRDGFAEEDRTLLICCEEGELEYDPRVLGNVFTYTVDEQSQLTPELFKKLEKQYRPKQVIIEYNGMWMIEPLYRDGLPANWILYQIMCLVDARSFEMYVKNMGQLMMEKISNADMLIFNHCNEELRAQLRSRNLRMVNRRADIYLENEDGTSEEYVTPEMSPFDLSDGHLDVPDDDYGVWYVDMMDNPDRYDGVTVRYKAVMCHSKKFKGVHCPGRFAMVCCENDMQFLALVAKGEGLEKFKNRQWVEITATVKKEANDAYQGEGPVLYVTAIAPCEKPKEEVVSF